MFDEPAARAIKYSFIAAATVAIHLIGPHLIGMFDCVASELSSK